MGSATGEVGAASSRRHSAILCSRRGDMGGTASLIVGTEVEGDGGCLNTGDLGTEGDVSTEREDVDDALARIEDIEDGLALEGGGVGSWVGLEERLEVSEQTLCNSKCSVLIEVVVNRKDAKERRLRDLSVFAFDPALVATNDFERGRVEFPRPPRPVDGWKESQDIEVRTLQSHGIDSHGACHHLPFCLVWRVVRRAVLSAHSRRPDRAKNQMGWTGLQRLHVCCQSHLFRCT